MTVAVARRRAGAVVADFDPYLVRRIPDGDLRVAGAGVLERVGETLLNNPIRGEVDPGGSGKRSPAKRSSTGSPARPISLINESRPSRPG